jgi:hypothetical protein
MSGRRLWVDLENVQKVDLRHLPADVHVSVFYGVNQKRISTELVAQAQPLGDRLEWVPVEGHGPNALDFHIAFYLGQTLATRPTTECIVVSGDTSFDPLVRHVTARGWTCRRVSSLDGVFDRPSVRRQTDSFGRLLRLLKKEKLRPTRMQGLSGKVKSWFPALSDAERQALLDRLFAEDKVQQVGTVLTYSV